MISAIVTERLMPGEPCRLEKGTLQLRKTKKDEEAVFVANAYLEAGEEVWLVPMDGSLIEVQQGVPVRGAATVPSGQRQGPGMTASTPTEG